MLFAKTLLLLSAAISPFALAQETVTVAGAPYTTTVKVMNAHSSSTPTPTPTPSRTPSSTPVHKFIASTGGIILPSGGRWNSTSIQPSHSSVYVVPTSQVVTVETTAASAPSPTHTGGAASNREVAGAMMAGVVAVAGLVMM
jgi:hypothetical protein